MVLVIQPNKVFKTLIIIIAFLFLTNVTGLILRFYFGFNKLFGIIPLFIFDYEANVPTWYSSVALLFCSLLLAVISIKKIKERDRYRSHWSVLSIIFLYLSLDETAQIHELTAKPLRDLFSLEGIFYYGWVLIGISFIVIFAIAYLKFFIDLPKKIQFLFALSGVLFVGGALGIELIGGWYDSTMGDDNLIYLLITTLEEILEMLGIAVFIYSLLIYIRLYIKKLTISIS